MLLRQLLKSLVVVTVLFLTACTKNESVNRQASPDIADSFVVKPRTTATNGGLDLTSDQDLVVIKKTALEKNFLLRVNTVSQELLPMFSAGQSRIIYFSRVFENLVAYEAANGFSTDADNKPARLIAVFPIASENDDEIAFDFNKGMQSLFVSDWSTGEDKVTTGYDLVQAESSFVKDVSYDKNRLVVSQWARIGMPEAAGDEDDPHAEEGKQEEKIVYRTVEFKYFLTPYQDNPTFTPSAFRNLKWAGFFTAFPHINKDGDKTINSVKFDLNKKIVYAVSANTPMELKGPIADAVLYWNKAFGKKVLDVVFLNDKEIKAPSPDYNIIQWVKNDDAGAAYADVQTDPLSGEILNVQVFMPSAFYVIGKAEAERFVKDYNKQSRRARFAIRGFEPLNNCFKELKPFATELADALASSSVTDDQIRLMSENYIISVVAHEVGHTLGLRHNFAGSTAATYTFKELPGIMKEFMATGMTPAGKVPTSTTMDYTLTEDDILVGSILRNPSQPALSYDIAAIQALYYGKDADSSAPAYCPDEEMGKYADCWIFDSGKSPVESFSEIFNIELKRASQRIFNKFAIEKSKGHKVVDVEVDQKAWLKRIMTARVQLTNFLSVKNKLLSVARKYSFAPGFEKQIQAESLDMTSQEIARLGGLNAVMTPLSFDWVSQSLTSFDDFIKNESTGVKMGKSYTLTKDEQTYMHRHAEGLLRALYSKMVVTDLTLTKALTLADHEMVDALAPYNLATAEYFGLSKSGKKSEKVVLKDGTSYDFELPTYTFDKATRGAALSLMGLKGRPGWGVAEKEKLTAEVMADLGSLLEQATKSQVDWSMTSPAVRHWFYEQVEILGAAGLVQ